MSDEKDKDDATSSIEANLQYMTWTTYLEDLMSNWSDNALSYAWLNSQAEHKYRMLNYMFTIPIVILSTVVGTINVGMNSLFPANLVQYGQIGIGGIGIFTGILGTLQNFFKYAQLSEAHRSCAIHWHKFYRLLKTELALEAICRKPAGEFFRAAKAEMDRLLDSSPFIPDDIISQYNERHNTVELPEIIGDLKSTSVYRGGMRMSPKQTPLFRGLPNFVKVAGEEASSLKNSFSNILSEQVSSAKMSLANAVNEQVSSAKTSVANAVNEQLSSAKTSVANAVNEKVSSAKTSVANAVRDEIPSMKLKLSNESSKVKELNAKPALSIIIDKK